MLNDHEDPYSAKWLNSGLDFYGQRNETFVPDRFCFLKLHGTAGMNVIEREGRPEYRWAHGSIANGSRPVDDSVFWAGPKRPADLRRDPIPLIEFPSEKKRSQSGDTTFPFDPYLRLLWGENGQAGQIHKILNSARAVYAIGYSFNPLDRSSIADLLSNSTCQVIIRNRSKEAGEAICDALRETHPALGPRLSCSGHAF